MYSDVILDEHWTDHAQDENPELWDALLGSYDENDEDLEAESDQENTTTDDERSRLSGLQFNTCIQPKDITADNNLLLNYAPGENKKPKSFHTDENSEELSFLTSFPTGKFGHSMKRVKPLSIKKYFQARILNADTRFANSIEYLFYAQYRCELKEIQDCLSLSLRKGKGGGVTAGDLEDNVSNFIRNDLGTHFMQKIRGSPAYFNKLFYDLLGMIRQFGPCTWFITLSAADLKWTDTISVIAKQQGKNLKTEEIEALT